MKVSLSGRYQTQKLTRRQAAIIGAYTGISCGPFADIHEYVDGLPGFKGIGTISFADPKVWEQIKRSCSEEFMALCSEQTEDPPPTPLEAAARMVVEAQKACQDRGYGSDLNVLNCAISDLAAALGEAK